MSTRNSTHRKASKKAAPNKPITIKLKTVDDYGYGLYTLRELSQFAFNIFISMQALYSLLSVDPSKSIEIRHIQTMLLPIKDRLYNVACGLEDIQFDDD